jgi:hypothetical protein
MSCPQKPLGYLQGGLPWLRVFVQGRGTGRKLGLLRAWFYARGLRSRAADGDQSSEADDRIAATLQVETRA